jgi:hypothetical protein
MAAPAATLVVKNTTSLTQALVQARADSNIQRIELTAGTYELAAPIVLDEAFSRRFDAPFVLTAVAGAHVVLAGTRSLPALQWEPWKDGIWRAHLDGSQPVFQRLWLGSQALIRARYPNFDPKSSAPFGGASADATSPERVRRWSDPAGGVLHALHGARWGGLQVPILGKKPDGSLDFGPQLANNRAMGPSERDRFVENIFEELDVPNEWFFDAKQGWLYFMPQPGSKPPALGFRAGLLETLVRVQGRSAEAHDIRVENLVFADTEPTFLKATEPLLRSDWKFYRAGAVTIENAHGVSVAGSEFRDLGGHAVVVSGRAEGVQISGNHVHHIGGSAITFVGRPSAVRSPLFEYYERLDVAAIDPVPGPKSDEYPKDSEASDNLIHDVGQIDKQAAGIELSMAERITLDHNTIYRVPRAGINVGDGTWGGHRISYNDVFDTVLESGDHGAFNSWGRDRYWHPDRAEMDRRVAAQPWLPGLDAVEPIVMRRNRFRCDHGWDVDLDDGASHYIIEQNLLLAGGLKLREGFGRIVRNNILVNGAFHPHVWFKNSGDVFDGNIVMLAHQPIEIHDWGHGVDHNLFTHAADLQHAQAAGTDAHSRAGDPLFANALAGDFTVTNAALAQAIGFVNFPMDDFGVRPARLKALAEQPKITAPQGLRAALDSEAPRTLRGLKLKSVQTLGEQSAAGLPSIAGVIVLAVQADGAAAGLQARDVIVGAEADAQGRVVPIDTADAFEKALAAASPAGGIDLVVVRNQARIHLHLSLR